MQGYIAQDNEQLAEREFAKQRIKLECFPQILIIMATDACNLRCVGCHFGQRTAPKLAIREDGYQRLFDAFTYLKNVMVTGAEMFYDAGNPKGYVQKIFNEALKHPNLRFVGNTNGTLISPKRAEMIVDKFEKIGVSIDSPDPNTYRTIRIGGDLYKVIRNIKKISRLKAQRGLGRSDFPHIYLNFIIIERTFKSVIEMIHLANEVGALVVTFQAPWEGTHTNEDIFQDRAKTMEYLSLRKKATAKANDMGVGIIDRTRNIIKKNMPELEEYLEIPEGVVLNKWPFCCKLPWSELYVSDTGDVTVCCTSKTVLGNVNQNSIFEIWNSPATLGLRRRILKGNYSRDCLINCCRGYILSHFDRGRFCKRVITLLSRIKR